MMNDAEEDLTNLERRAAGTMLYLSLLEIFSKYEIFKNPIRVSEVLFGTIDVFIKQWLENYPEENTKLEIKKNVIKGLEELISRLKEEN